MGLEFKSSNKELFSNQEKQQVRDYFNNVSPINANIIKGYFLERFDSYVRDENVSQPLEKYQELENFAIGLINKNPDNFGLKKGEYSSDLTMFNNTKGTPFMNKYFRKHMGTLSSDEYSKVVNGYKIEFNKVQDMDNKEYLDHKTKVENLKNVRNDRNIFVKFFYWLFGIKGREDEMFESMDEKLESTKQDLGIENDFVLFTDEKAREKEKEVTKDKVVPFSVDDIDFVDEFDEERPKEVTPLITEKFRISENMHHYDHIENLGIISDGITAYKKRESYGNYSREQLNESLKEIKDKAAFIGIDEETFNKAVESKQPISEMLHGCPYPKQYTKEEVEEYNGPELNI